MLLRFLTIATLSVTYLSVQALSSTETRSERLSAGSALSQHDLRELPTFHQMAMFGKWQGLQSAIPPLPQSHRAARYKFAELQKQRQLAHKRQEVITITTNVEKKEFVHLSYMPAAYHPNKTDADYIAEATQEPEVTASIETPVKRMPAAQPKLNSYKIKPVTTVHELEIKPAVKKGNAPKTKYSLGVKSPVAVKAKKKKYRKNYQQTFGYYQKHFF